MKPDQRIEFAAQIKSVLSLWMAYAISSEAVVTWAERMILATEEPDEALIELSRGPEAYLRIPLSEVPKPEPLSFLDEFSIRASALNPSVSSELERFIDWASHACLGQDESATEVHFSYRLFFRHIEGGDVDGARTYALEALPALLAACRDRAAPFWKAYAQATAADRPEAGAG